VRVCFLLKVEYNKAIFISRSFSSFKKVDYRKRIDYLSFAALHCGSSYNHEIYNYLSRGFYSSKSLIGVYACLILKSIAMEKQI
jgi:hypothetical protein